MKPLEIIFRIWSLEDEWNALNDPQLNWYGNTTFRRLNYDELFRAVAIQDEQKLLCRELRKEIGWWNYLKFKVAPLKFAKSLSAYP